MHGNTGATKQLGRCDIRIGARMLQGIHEHWFPLGIRLTATVRDVQPGQMLSGRIPALVGSVRRLDGCLQDFHKRSNIRGHLPEECGSFDQFVENILVAVTRWK